MKPDIIERYFSIFRMRTPRLFRFMFNAITAMGYQPIKGPKSTYIYAAGTIPIMVVAHLDTVFDDRQGAWDGKRIFHDPTAKVLWSPEGLGADDRAGIIGILRLLGTGLRPFVLLTTGEEKGCLGAHDFASDYGLPPTGLKYMLEIDRAGRGHAVFYDCDGEKAFTDYITGFGIEKKIGSMSDVGAIMKVWGICGANLACGYYDNHSTAEHLNYSDLSDTLQVARKMLNSPPDVPFTYKPTPVYQYYSFLGKNDLVGEKRWGEKYSSRKNLSGGLAATNKPTRWEQWYNRKEDSRAEELGGTDDSGCLLGI